MNDEQNKITIKVDGMVYGGWKSARVEVSIDQLSRAFALSVTDNFPGNESFSRLRAGQKVELFIGQDKVCTGYITSTPVSYDSKSINVQVQGKSKTVDLVDCCPPWAAVAPPPATGSGGDDTWEDVDSYKNARNTKEVQASQKAATSWHNQPVEKIMADLCAVYGVKVFLQTFTGKSKLTNFTVNPGEKVFDSLKRLLIKDNLVVMDDAGGNLVITDAGAEGQAADALVTGKNILSGAANFDASRLFSKYVVLGQHKGTDTEFAKKVSQDKGVSDDADAERYRLLVIKDTGQSSNALAGSRADFEKSLRQAEYEVSTHKVQGWRQSNGALWTVNTMVMVEDSILRLSGLYLIRRVTYSLDSSGTTCDIETVPIAGYTRDGYKPQAAGGSSAPDTWSDTIGKDGKK